VPEGVHHDIAVVDQNDVGLRALQFVYQPQSLSALSRLLPRKRDYSFVGLNRHGLQPRTAQASAKQRRKARRPGRRLEPVRGKQQALAGRMNGKQKLFDPPSPQPQKHVFRAELEYLGDAGARQTARQFIDEGLEEEDVHGKIRLAGESQ